MIVLIVITTDSKLPDAFGPFASVDDANKYAQACFGARPRNWIIYDETTTLDNSDQITLVELSK
jgi:hypothetical protein